MRRRAFIATIAGAAAWPLALRAQQPAMPAIGFLRSSPAAPFAHTVTAFRQGLADMGFVEGRNVAIEQRWADNRLDRLPGLAAELVRREVAAIVGNLAAVKAAQAATGTIPIVFVVGNDPITHGLVSSLSRPEGNVTGVTFFGGSELNSKRMELLHELVPAGKVIAVLVDPSDASSASGWLDAEAAGRALGRRTERIEVAGEGELDAAFARMEAVEAGAMLVGGSPFFTSHRRKLVELAARHTLPTIYDLREYAEAGGLVSYAASLAGAYRQAGAYAGRILKGEKPADLPIQNATQIELVVNLNTAKALGLTVPPSLLARADEVIE
jgi:putative ABC transport system substrate-binding protein